MALALKDTFTGAASGEPTSGAKPAPTVGGARIYSVDIALASPATGDQYDYIIHFASGDVTLRLVWTSGTAMEFRRISTISGQTFDELMGTATTSGTRPIIGAPFNVSLLLTSSGGNTVFSMGYGRSGHATNGITSSPFSRTLTGSLTPTGADFAITGASFAHYPGMEGRVPDGGGDPGLAVGSWLRYYVPFTEYEVLEVRSGACSAARGTRDSTFYGVSGYTPPSADYQTRVVFAEGPDIYAAYVGATIRQQPDGSCYLAEVYANNVDSYVFTIYYFSAAGAYTNLVEVDAYPAALESGDHTIEFEGVGADLTARLITGGVTVQTLTVTDSTITAAGVPGLECGNFNTNEINVQIVEFGVDDGSTGEPGPCDFIQSHHQFIGSRLDIDGQRTDTFPGRGIWAAHPASGATIGNGGRGRAYGVGRAIYRDDVPDMPVDCCVQVGSLYPQVIGTPATPGTPDYWSDIWIDEFDGTLGTLLAGRVHNGGSAGTGTWTRIDSGDSSGPEATLDGAGRVYNPTAVAADPFYAAYAPLGLTLPSNGTLRVLLDIYNDGTQVGSADNRGRAGLLLRYQNTAPVTYAHPPYLEAYYWYVDFSDDLTGPFGPYNFYHTNTGATSGGLGGTEAGGQHIDALETSQFTTTIEGQGAAPATIGVLAEDVAAFTFYDGQFNARSNFDTGPPGIIMGAAYYGNPARISRFAIESLGGGTPGTPAVDAPEVADAEVFVRLDATALTGYGLRQTFDHSDVNAAPICTYELAEYTAGVRTVYRSSVTTTAHGVSRTLNLRVVGNVLTATLDGSLLWTVDTAVEGGVHATGGPGLGGSDASGTGDFLYLSDYIVYGEKDAGLPCSEVPAGDPCIPCEGTPDNPYPQDPPPPVPPLELLVYVVQQGAWRPFNVPRPDLTTALRVHGFGAARESTGLRVMAEGAWRYVGEVSDVDPPPDTPLPPGYDPCELLLPPTLPPGGVDPLPVTSRFFFCWDLAATQIGPIFTAAMRVLGPWSGTDISQAAARGGVILGSQGGYSQYFTGGVYDPAKMNAHIDALVPLSGMLQTATANGSFYGVQVFDDFDSVPRWPPSGISRAEIARVCAYWKSKFPWGIRTMIRGRPTQTKLAGGIANLDTCTAQYRYWGLGTPSAFLAAEASEAAASGYDMLWSLNFEHGSPSHGFCSPAQVYDYFTLAAANLPHHGMGGWKMSSQLLAIPGMIDALVASRNLLAGLPPP